jgi:hypothetical protein
MRFIALVKSSPESEAGVLPDEQALSEMGAYNDELLKAGVMLAGEGLHASSKGCRVNYVKGKLTVIDGPFAEAKELVAGFWLLKANSKDEVVAWLKKAPFREGEVEVRPLFEVEDFPVDPAEVPGGWRDKEVAAAKAPSLQTTRGKKKMRFMGFVLADEATEAGVMPEEKGLAAMGSFIEEATKSGVFLAGEGLKPSSHGVRIRYQGSARTVVDGPFAESKELIAGYSILAVDSKEEALAWTKRFAQVDAGVRPSGDARCELRQIFELEDFPVSPAEKADGWRAQEQRLRDDLSR